MNFSRRFAKLHPCVRAMFLWAAVLFLDCGSHALADDAQKANGSLIVMISTPTIAGEPDDQYLNITLRIRRRDGSDSEDISDSAGNWLSSDKNDFVGTDEGGMMFTHSLTPGDWEVYSFAVTTGNGAIFWVKNDFSIPFTINSGRATYIGDFKTVGTTYRNLLGIIMPGGARMIVTDRSARDLPIAQAKKPDLGSVDVSVFDVDKLANPLLTAR